MVSTLVSKSVLKVEVSVAPASVVLVLGVAIALAGQELAVVSLVPARTSLVEAAGSLFGLIFGMVNSVCVNVQCKR